MMKSLATLALALGLVSSLAEAQNRGQCARHADCLHWTISETCNEQYQRELCVYWIKEGNCPMTWAKPFPDICEWKRGDIRGVPTFHWQWKEHRKFCVTVDATWITSTNYAFLSIGDYRDCWGQATVPIYDDHGTQISQATCIRSWRDMCDLNSYTDATYYDRYAPFMASKYLWERTPSGMWHDPNDVDSPRPAMPVPCRWRVEIPSCRTAEPIQESTQEPTLLPTARPTTSNPTMRPSPKPTTSQPTLKPTTSQPTPKPTFDLSDSRPPPDGESDEGPSTIPDACKASGCTAEMWGDGFCDVSCNTAECYIDNGDCDQYVQVAFLEDAKQHVTPFVKQAFKEAMDKWNRIITTIASEQDTSMLERHLCKHEDHFVYPPNYQFNGLIIQVAILSIDGPAGLLGSASFCGIIRNEENRALPRTGKMRFDIDDVRYFETTTRESERNFLRHTIIHEMGHVLGIGALWNYNALLENIDVNPRYNGPHANQVYHNWGGTHRLIAAEDTGGGGTRLAHWRDRVFVDELMTGYLSRPTNYLSAMSAAGLQDLGYTVNMAAADDYTLPQFRVNAAEVEPAFAFGDDVDLGIITIEDPETGEYRTVDLNDNQA